MRKFTLFTVCLTLLSLIHRADAAATNILYWDPNGTASIGGNAIWNTTSQWSTNSTQSDSLVLFNSADIACFSAGPTSSASQGSLTVTINRTNTCVGIDNGTDGPGSCFLTLVAGSTGLLKLSGTVNTGGATQGSTSINVPIAGTAGITFVGPWSCYLNATNQYSGSTTVSSGSLVLGATGSISNSSLITVSAGGTLDVSAIPAFYLSTSNAFKSTGSATAAKIIGGTTINFGSQPITMTYDGTHPSLTIAQGALVLNGNAFTINKATALPLGTYTVVTQTTGNISGSGSLSVTGTAIPAGATGSISVSNGTVVLIVATTTTTTLNTLTPSNAGQSVTFTATVAPTPSGGTVQFYDNGVALGSPVIVTSGTASYQTSSLTVGNHPITAVYSGTTGFAASSTGSPSIQQVNAASTTITGLTELGNGSVQFAFTGLAGSNYVIQAATNLAPPTNWISIGTNTQDINGNSTFTDAAATNYPIRFYRIALPGN